MSEDPIGLGGGNNLYSYVGGNPLAYVDPLGLAEHTKGARPSTKGKHEAGDARRGRDRGGEKGDANRSQPRQKPPGWKGPWPPKPESEPEPEPESESDEEDPSSDDSSPSMCGKNCQQIPKVIFSVVLGTFILVMSWVCF